jgi:hypothetical protein
MSVEVYPALEQALETIGVGVLVVGNVSLIFLRGSVA